MLQLGLEIYALLSLVCFVFILAIFMESVEVGGKIIPGGIDMEVVILAFVISVFPVFNIFTVYSMYQTHQEWENDMK